MDDEDDESSNMSTESIMDTSAATNIVSHLPANVGKPHWTIEESESSSTTDEAMEELEESVIVPKKTATTTNLPSSNSVYIDATSSETNIGNMPETKQGPTGKTNIFEDIKSSDDEEDESSNTPEGPIMDTFNVPKIVPHLIANERKPHWTTEEAEQTRNTSEMKRGPTI